MLNLKYHLPLFLFLFFSSQLAAQNSNNPFEIVPRLDPVVLEATEKKKATGVPDNPFDMVRPSSVVQPSPSPSPPKAALPPKFVEETHQNAPVLLGDDKSYRRFLFITVLVMLIVLTLLFTLFRLVISKAWQGFLNANILNQLYRERSLVTQAPYFILYSLFFLNAGIFAMLLTKYYNITIAQSNLGALALCVGGIGGFFLMRHAILSLVGYIFPVKKETGTYSFSLTIFNIIMGLMLVPMILLVAYSPDYLSQTLIPVFLFILLGIYFYLLLRGILLANRYVLLHKFHFLLYICAVEIAPLMIVIKWLSLEGVV